ncbi:MAG: sulfatase-like hydrolase/transferase [Planctomycetota bacterium]|jgi:arylsulfatase A-like enzyme|nr:sulfatase-like hydrolase/transferase [Planctomycetota bacterium]
MSRPDILVIMTDQQRWDALGCAGNPDIKTPHLDALAADGVYHAESFCPFPICTPSRFSALSGRYARQHFGSNNHSGLPPGVPTWPKALRSAGYRTACVGKMHFAPTYLDVGFDHMTLAEQNGPGRDDDDYHRYLRERGLHDQVDLLDQVGEFRERAQADYWSSLGALESNLSEEHHSTTWIGDRCLDDIAAWGDHGNCLMAGFIKPHHPFDPPAPWSEMYDPDALSLVPGWTDAPLARDLAEHTGFFPHDQWDEAALRRCMALYYASISQIDSQVGRIIDALKAAGRYDNTMIVFTADHGEYLGFHHLLLKNNHMYDPVMRVPLIIKYPEQTRRGEHDERLVTNLDLAPSICACAGITWHRSPLSIDLTDTTQDRDCLFAETDQGREYMVRTKQHKLLVTPENSFLFDLSTDPQEMTDCAAEASALRDQLRERLVRWSLFEATAPGHFDPDAALAPGSNVLGETGPHRDQSQAYWREAMQDL